MAGNHSWSGAIGTPTLKARTPQGRTLLIGGVEVACVRRGCRVRMRETIAGNCRTYSLDAGKTWGAVGGIRPPCNGERRR